MREPLLEPAVAMSLGELGDQRRRGGEQHRVARHNSFPAERYGEMRFPYAWRLEKQNGFTIGDEAAGGDLADPRLVERGLRAEVEAREVAAKGKRASPYPMSMRRWSRRATSRSQNIVRASRIVSSRRPLRRSGCRADRAWRQALAEPAGQ